MAASCAHPPDRQCHRDAIASIDFFPNEASVRAQSAWQDFVAAADAVLSPGEPHQAEGTIKLVKRADYQGPTRRRLWVDRVASAWLVRRFVDGEAQFLWLASPDDCPVGAVGFDFDGATFSHINDRVTFEVMTASFGIKMSRAWQDSLAWFIRLMWAAPRSPKLLGSKR